MDALQLWIMKHLFTFVLWKYKQQFLHIAALELARKGLVQWEQLLVCEFSGVRETGVGEVLGCLVCSLFLGFCLDLSWLFERLERVRSCQV